MNYEIRNSTAKDVWQIKRLIYNCFGDREDEPLVGVENGRYLLAEVDGRIIGMSGINKSKQFNGFEVDWSCVDEHYRKQGVMHRLIATLLYSIPENTNVYCSCWAIGKDDAPIAMKSIMESFGFEEVTHGRVRYCAMFNSTPCMDSCSQRLGSCCTCREDLYIRYWNKNTD